MSKTIISVDSAADMPADVAERLGIKCVPMHVIVNGSDRLDGVDFFGKDIFEHCRKTGTLPSTSAVSPGEYSEFFSRCLAEGCEVLHLSFSSELSSSHRNARLASCAFSKVFVLDTLSLAGGMSLLAVKACEMRDNGSDAEYIFHELKKLVPLVRVSYVLNSVEYLKKSGRCSALSAFGAELLCVKVCAGVENGRVTLLKKYRGKAKAVRRQYADEQLEKSENIDFSAAFISHSGLDGAELSMLKNKLVSAGFKNVIVAETGCMISLHSAENAVGIHYLLKNS